jgi:quercetin dioxygenase-like cupin family protein
MDGPRNLEVRVLTPSDRPLPLVDGAGTAVPVVSPATGARHRSMNLLHLDAGAATLPLRHPTEAVYFLRAGRARVTDVDRATGQDLVSGSMVHIGPGAAYRFDAAEDADLVGGPCPPDPSLYEAEVDGATARPPGESEIRAFHVDEPSVRVPLISRDARLVVWPGVNAETANMNYVRLEPGEENTPHIHAESEDTVFILEGRGTVADLTNDRDLPFEAGQAVHVPPGVRHALKADRGVEVRSVGGPCPADPMIVSAALATLEGDGVD